MKVLVIGGGSMGRRRLRDLTAIVSGKVALYEPVATRCKDVAAAYGVQSFTELETALAVEPDAVAVSTPPALHEPYVMEAMRRNLHVFAELPFVLDEQVMTDVARQAGNYPATLGISHTIRYYPPFRLIRDLLHNGAIGQPFYLEYSLGNYLPDWHPYEDYRDFYAKEAQLGGSGLDMILHEMSAIQWWMGPLTSVSARLSKLGPLEVNGPDSHDVLMQFASGAQGFFHHDILEQGTVGRHIRIAGERGTIEWRQDEPRIRLYAASSKENEQLSFDRAADWPLAIDASREVSNILARHAEQSGAIPAGSNGCFTYESCYLREIRNFIDLTRGHKEESMIGIHEELHTVQVYHAVLLSASRGARIELGGYGAHRA